MFSILFTASFEDDANRRPHVGVCERRKSSSVFTFPPAERAPLNYSGMLSKHSRLKDEDKDLKFMVLKESL